MTDVTCPQCGTMARLETLDAHADCFCRECDFPLFWVQNPVGVRVGDDTSEMSLRRLPGAEGRESYATRACPHCGEHNTFAAIICVRCSLPMSGEIPDATEPVEAPPPPPPPEPYVERREFPVMWLILLVIVILGAVMATAYVLAG